MDKYNTKLKASGQSLIEVLIAIAIGIILISAASLAMIPILRSNLETKKIQVANSLAQKYLDNLNALVESNWQSIYSPPAPKGASSQFYLTASGTSFAVLAGTTSTVVGGETFTRYFSIENVNRASCGIGNITTSATTSDCYPPTSWPASGNSIADDPSTQKITVMVSWGGNRSISETQYLTRNNNKIFRQTDWSGGPGQEGPITAENNQFATSTNIDYTSLAGSITAVTSSASLISSIFDTQAASGTAINTIMWQGNSPASTTVQFQIASDSTSTPATWNYRGPDGSNITYYTPTAPNFPIQVNPAYHNNQRFFRYKIFLGIGSGQTQSSRVDDVIINFSQ